MRIWDSYKRVPTSLAPQVPGMSCAYVSRDMPREVGHGRRGAPGTACPLRTVLLSPRQVKQTSQTGLDSSFWAACQAGEGSSRRLRGRLHGES